MKNQQLPKEDMLLYFDEKGYNDVVEVLTSLISPFEKVIKLFNGLGLGEFDKKDFRSLIFDAENLIYLKTIDKLGKIPTEIGGLKISKTKLFDILEKPAGYTTLMEEVKKIVTIFFKHRMISLQSSSALYCGTPAELFNFFTFDDNAKIVVKDSVMEKVTQHFTRYVKSDKAKKVSVLATSLHKALAEAGITEFVGSDEFRNFLSTLIMFEPESKSLKMNYDYILTFEGR